MYILILLFEEFLNTYTPEEKELVSELPRNDMLRKKKEKAAILSGAESYTRGGGEGNVNLCVVRMNYSFTECSYSYCTSHQNILLTCDFPTDYRKKHTKMA